MATATVTVRLDAEDKAAMERACKEMGLSMLEAGRGISRGLIEDA